MTRQELIVELASLRNEAMPLTLEKKKLEAELSRLKAQVHASGRRGLPVREFQEVCNLQASTKHRIVYLEQKYQAIKSQIRTKQAQLDAAEEPPGGVSHGNPEAARLRNLQEQLGQLRSRWELFVEDPSKLDSQRNIASLFVSELAMILARAS
jgi:predicted  nucleic acid-binding Zn-ribbon protein